MENLMLWGIKQLLIDEGQERNVGRMSHDGLLQGFLKLGCWVVKGC